MKRKLDLYLLENQVLEFILQIKPLSSILEQNLLQNSSLQDSTKIDATIVPPLMNLGKFEFVSYRQEK